MKLDFHTATGAIPPVVKVFIVGHEDEPLAIVPIYRGDVSEAEGIAAIVFGALQDALEEGDDDDDDKAPRRDPRRAIEARENGVFDDPDLCAYLPALSVSTAKDVLEIKRMYLVEDIGWIAGPRDPRLNTNYAGQFMVCEPFDDDEVPTKDGINGPWCVVGDDIDELIAAAFPWAYEERAPDDDDTDNNGRAGFDPTFGGCR